jgi:hypothetical protein
MAANRGKVAETSVRKMLDSLHKRQDFCSFRLPDAHGGSMVQTLADFLVVYKGHTILLEVKEVQHDYRLPVGNFKLQNRNKLTAYKVAGATTLVMIHHSTTGNWRIVEADWFGNLNTGSWDLREFQEFETPMAAFITKVSL